MKTPQNFQLIDGTFTPKEAGQILFAIVKGKLDHHRMEKVSNEERFGSDRSHSAKRLDELVKLDRELRDLVASAADANQVLKINGWIAITTMGDADPAG